MNRRSAIMKLMVSSAGLFFARRLAADGPIQPGTDDATQQSDEPGNYVLHSEVRLVLLDVSVTNRQGNFVSGLTKENFGVSENGRPQPITVFDHGDAPVTVGILVDESRSMTPKRNDVLTAAETFIEKSNPQDETFVLSFNDTVRPGLAPPTLFSDKFDELHAALLRGIPEGRTALNDAVVAGLKQLELGKRDKKTLIVISDGGDNASGHTRREMLDMVERSIATIYTIGLFDPEDPDRDPGILQRLAKISGGEAYLPASSAEMVPVCRRIAEDIRARYTLGYIPPANKGSDPVRHIRVRVTAPDLADPKYSHLVARTRSSYRYDEGQSQKAK